jgi:hypothetical protein
MSNHASHAALPYPIKNTRFTVYVPLVDADGDPTAQTTPDTEISEDNAAATDAAEEVSATSGMDGMGMITFTGAETDCSLLAANFKAASGPKATLMTLYPRVLAEVGTGTLSAGSAGGGTLGSLLAYDVTGCFIKTTGGTGGGGAGGANNQARKIVTYNTGTGAFTVTPNWETTPSTDTTYAVLLPEGVTLGMLKAINPTTPGRTLDVAATGEAGLDFDNIKQATGATTLTNITVPIVTTLTNLPAITANWLTAAGIAAGALNGKGDWNIGKTGYALSAAGVQAIWDALTTALSTVGSIGKLLVDNINATISSRATESKANDIQVATAAIEVDTQDIQSRLPAALTGAGNMKVDVLAWLGTAPATPTVAGVPKVDVTHFGGMAGAFTFGIPSTNVQLWGGTTAQLTPELLPLVGVGGIGAQGAVDLRAALGLATANLDTQLGNIPTVAEFEARTLVAANYATAANQITVAQIWTTALTESYRATGETGTGAQLFYEILANLINFGNVGTTKTITDLAGSPVKTYTYDSAASPTAIEEST